MLVKPMTLKELAVMAANFDDYGHGDGSAPRERDEIISVKLSREMCVKLAVQLRQDFDHIKAEVSPMKDIDLNLYIDDGTEVLQ